MAVAHPVEGVGGLPHRAQDAAHDRDVTPLVVTLTRETVCYTDSLILKINHFTYNRNVTEYTVNDI